MRHLLRVVAAPPQGVRQCGEGGRRPLGERLPGFSRPQPFGVGHRPFELVTDRGIREIVQREFGGGADAVGPVGVDAEPRHVRDDQQRWVFQGECVLP